MARRHLGAPVWIAGVVQHELCVQKVLSAHARSLVIKTKDMLVIKTEDVLVINARTPKGHAYFGGAIMNIHQKWSLVRSSTTLKGDGESFRESGLNRQVLRQEFNHMSV